MAKKQLPFKTQPRVESYVCGNETIGELEFPVYGDFTINEQVFVNDSLAGNSVFLEIARISNKLAKQEKIQPIAAHRFLTKAVTAGLTPEIEVTFSEKEESRKIKYAREIEELSQFLLRNQFETQLVTVTAVIRHRLKDMEDFSVDDARELPQQLVQSIYAFALTEQTADYTEEPEEETDQELEETLKK